MRCEIKKVIYGINRYMNDNIYEGMADWQEVLARTFIGSVLGSEEQIVENLKSNGLLKTFAIIDENGMADISNIAISLKREIERKEKISVKIPVIGKYTFNGEDVNVLYKCITGEELVDEED